MWPTTDTLPEWMRTTFEWCEPVSPTGGPAEQKAKFNIHDGRNRWFFIWNLWNYSCKLYGRIMDSRMIMFFFEYCTGDGLLA